jgi:chemotaxis protein CheC
VNLAGGQIDALKELINMGVGRAASVLNTMLRSHVRLQAPFIEILSPSALEQKKREQGRESLSTVRLAFTGPFSGTASLVFPIESAAKLVAVLTDDETTYPDLDSIRTGTLTEVGNIVLNGVMGVIGNELEQHIQYSVPTYIENPIEILLTDSQLNSRATVIWTQTQFTIEQYQIDSNIILLFEAGSFEALLAALDQAMGIQH